MTFTRHTCIHHHHQVARPAVSIAVSTTERHLERSCARSHAELRPRLVGCRSDSMVRSQVRRGRPLRRRQSVGRRLMAAWRAREWSCDGSARAICPNRRNRLDTMVQVTGGCPVLRLTSSFVTWAVYAIRNIHLYWAGVLTVTTSLNENWWLGILKFA